MKFQKKDLGYRSGSSYSVRRLDYALNEMLSSIKGFGFDIQSLLQKSRSYLAVLISSSLFFPLEMVMYNFY